jgi:tetratricopeptide (TPR) repeat protein
MAREVDPLAVTAQDAEDRAAVGASFGEFEVTGVLGRGGVGVVFAAHDPQLDRDVAIKVLHAGDPALLQREAQAMAKLAHPNVVTVYEVRRGDAGVFVVMERVAGTTLRAWIAEPHPWRETVAMFVAAGRGLAAAHDAKLVHRDFKPDNVLIGDDGRPRVADFGLALGASGKGGTPAYMAPEQWRGDAVDARADQFAFCVALWEALCGRAPFAGDSRDDLRDAVLAGRRRDDAKPPRRVAAAIERGLASDPERRWPTMAALLDALERGRADRRATYAVAAAVLVAGAAGLVMQLRSHDDPCRPPTARVAAAWGLERQALVAANLAAHDPAAAERAAAVGAVLDPGLAAWSDAYVGACRATRVDGAQSDTMLDLRVRCLDRWLARADAVAGRLQTATAPRAIADAVAGIYQIGDLAACSDVDALRAASPPPEPAIADEVKALGRELDAAEAARLAGDMAPQRSIDLLARARALGYAPLVARALDVRARMQGARNETKGVAATDRELVEAAAAAKNDALAAEAWLRLIGDLKGIDRATEAIALFPAARAAVTRAGGGLRREAELLYREGKVLSVTDRNAEALVDLDKARELLAAHAKRGDLLAPLAEDVDVALGDALQNKPDVAGSIAAYRRSIAASEQLYGPDNPDEVFALVNMTLPLRMATRYDEALAVARRALRIEERYFGASVLMIPTLNGEGETLLALHRGREALAPIRRSVEIARADPKASVADVTSALLELGNVVSTVDGDAAAIPIYGEAIAIFEKQPADTHHFDFPVVLLNRATSYVALGRCADAIADLERSARLVAEYRNPDFFWNVWPLTYLGRCQVELGHPDVAIPTLEHAVALKVTDELADVQSQARFWLGRARVVTGRDRAGGLAQARAARDALAAHHDEHVPAMTKWLDAQR